MIDHTANIVLLGRTGTKLPPRVGAGVDTTV
jgi:hypothetical protein